MLSKLKKLITKICICLQKMVVLKLTNIMNLNKPYPYLFTKIISFDNKHFCVAGKGGVSNPRGKLGKPAKKTPR